jgi:hypothetical protein
MWNKKWIGVGFGVCWLVAAGACSWSPRESLDPKKLAQPQARLTEYVSRTFAIRTPEDRSKLVELMTGKVKERMLAWSREEFKAFFLDRQREMLKFLIKDVKEISPTETQVTYELIFTEKAKAISEPGVLTDRWIESKITHRRLAQLVLEGGQWFIADVRNVRELIEFKGEMAIP